MKIAVKLSSLGRLLSLSLCAALLVISAKAEAASVYLNGVNIDGVTGQTFNHCTVQIDGKGDVFITAKGYQVQSVGGGEAAPASPTPNVPPPAPVVTNTQPAAPAAPTAPVAQQSAITPTGPITMRYWLVSETAVPGMSQYDIDIYINNSHVKRISSKDQQVVMDVTKYMKAGNNIVYLVAKKNLTAGRLSTSPQHYLKVIIGESSKADAQEVYIEKEVLSYTRTAAEDKDYSDMINVSAR